MLAKPVSWMIRITVYEDDQIATAGIGRSSPYRRSGVAAVCSSVQSADLHATSIVRVLGAQGLLRLDLPRSRGPAGRLYRSGGSDWAGIDPALHHTAEGRRSAARIAFLSSSSRCDGSHCTTATRSAASLSFGGDGHQRIRIQAHQPLLRPATQNDGKTWANTPRRVSALSQTGHCLRHGKSFRPGGASQSGTAAGLWRLRTVAARGAGPHRCEDDVGGRGFRQRTESRVGSRQVGDSNTHPRDPWATGSRRADRPLSKSDEATFAPKPIRPTLASGNGLFHDETSQRRSRQRSQLLASLPTLAAQNNYTQHHNPG